MKQAYMKKWGDYSDYWVRVELTGRCSKVTGGPPEEDRHYYQAQKRWFGIPVYKYWINKTCVKFFDPIIKTEYDCDCGEAE